MNEEHMDIARPDGFGIKCGAGYQQKRCWWLELYLNEQVVAYITTTPASSPTTQKLPPQILEGSDRACMCAGSVHSYGGIVGYKFLVHVHRNELFRAARDPFMFKAPAWKFQNSLSIATYQPSAH